MPEININESGGERLVRNWTEYLRNNPQIPAIDRATQNIRENITREAVRETMSENSIADIANDPSLSLLTPSLENNTSIRDVAIEENRRINDRLNMATDPDLIQPRTRTALEQSIYEDTMRREGFDPTQPARELERPVTLAEEVARIREYEDEILRRNGIDPSSLVEPRYVETRFMEISGYSVPYHSSDRADAMNLAMNSIRMNSIREEVNNNMRIPDHLIRPNAIIPTEPPNNTDFRVPFDRIPLNPTSVADMTSEEQIRNYANLIGMNLTPKTPQEAYEYAILKNTPQPHLEPLIATSDFYSFVYARNVLKGRFIAGEPKILAAINYKEDYTNEFITPDLIKQLNLKRSSITNPITTLILEE